MSSSNYEMILGLEVHVQLKTATKLFCSCSTNYSNKPANSHVCEVCMGLPGVLPVLNRQVLNYAMRACEALECQVSKVTKFDRKHYFYPDLPKAYQISQFDLPIGEHGALLVDPENAEPKKIGITRIHMEEDAGKLVHADNGESLVDYNRACVPLLEIVSEPDMRTAEEARSYLEKLRQIMRYIGVSDCDMENGSLRCDVNISVRPVGQTEFGTKVEIKNMNSFRSVVRAIEYERTRQVRAHRRGEKQVQCTLLWDDAAGETRVMRVKENANDYRYFPEPDLPPIHITEKMLQSIRANLPELPDKKIQRLIETYSIPDYNARLLAEDRDLADYFERACAAHPNYGSVSNWIMTELLRELNRELLPVSQSPIKAEDLATLVRMIDDGRISGRIAKEVFETMVETGESPERIVEEKGLLQVSDEGELQGIVNQVLQSNPESIDSILAGKKKAFGFLVGQVMKQTAGKANPSKVNEILKISLKQRYGATL